MWPIAVLTFIMSFDAANLGAPQALAPRDLLPPIELDYSSSFQKRNARVRNAILNLNPPQLSAFVPPTNTPFDLYEKQTYRGLSGPQADAASFSAGVALFAALTVIVARAPEPVRALFDGPARFGPAILRDGGLGAGFGYRW